VPIATQSFTAPYRYGVDGFTDVVEGEYVAEGHELVLRFADKFRPGSTPPSRSAAWRAAGSRPRTRRTAGRASYAAGAPRLDVVLTERAYRDIDAAEGFDGLETCGALFGRRTSRGFEITGASGPGPAKRAASAVRHSFDYYDAVERAQAHTGDRLVGHWHTHPSGDSAPSETDLRSWRLVLEDGHVDDDACVHLIVTEDPNPYAIPGLRFHGWTTTSDGTRSAPVTLT
jgi:integrative and conjugative element protein (TIGR02256 family)